MEAETTPQGGWSEAQIAAELATAEHDRRDVIRFTLTHPDLGLDAAYRIQARGIQRRLSNGRRRVGVKLGLTSVAKQQQMGVSAPLVGVLTDEMQIARGDSIGMSGLIHPKVEPEIVFIMGADLAGPGVTAEDARAAVASVHAGIEVIDSRYRNFDFRLADVVADNASSARFVVHTDGFSPDELDLVAETVELSIDGTPLANANGSAVMGNPYAALAHAANDLATRDDAIRAGEIVLSGALTDAKPISTGQTVLVDFSHLGALALHAD